MRDPAWESEFRTRMHSFELGHPPREGEIALSLKVRVTSGCFHREHSPSAYALIDRHIASISSRERGKMVLVEHESGPELLVYLALAASGVTLAASLINLVVAVLNARHAGAKSGDRPNEPVEVIVRRTGDGDRFAEETVLRVGHDDPVDRADIEARIDAALKRLADKSDP